MSSRALADWDGARRLRIGELYAAHRAAERAHRPLRAEQVTRTLVLALAAEFQGFARALHDDCVRSVTKAVGSPEELVESVERAYTARRNLDSRNPTYDALNDDFGRFGMTLRTALVDEDPGAAGWLASLDELLKIRNAMAHAVDDKLDDLAPGGVTLLQVRRWHAALRELAAAMTSVAGRRLTEITGSDSPWDP